MKNLIIIITLLISSSINLIAQKVVIPEHIQKTYNITDVYKYTKLGVGGLEAERIALNIPKTRDLNQVIDYLVCQTDGMSDHYKLLTVLMVVARNIQYNYVYLHSNAPNVKEYHNLFKIARGDKSFPQYVDDFDYEYPLTINDYTKLDSLWKVLRRKNGSYGTQCGIRAYNQKLESGKYVLPNGEILNSYPELVFKKGYGACSDFSILFEYISNRINLKDYIVKYVSSSIDVHATIEVKSKTDKNFIKYIDPTCESYFIAYKDPITKESSIITRTYIGTTYFMVNKQGLPFNKGFYK